MMEVRSIMRFLSKEMKGRGGGLVGTEKNECVTAKRGLLE